MRPVVCFSSFEVTVFVKPLEGRHASAIRRGRRSQRPPPNDSYDVDRCGWWAPIAQRFNPTPLERAILTALAAKGVFKLYAREADLEARIRRAKNR